MAAVPSHRIYPRTTRLQFFRYASSIHFGKLSFSSIVNSGLDSDETPRKRSNFVLKTKKKTWVLASEAPIANSKPEELNSPSSSWLDKWDEPQNQTKLKRPQEAVNYRNSDDFEETNDVSGSTMDRIVRKLKEFGYVDDVSERSNKEEKVIEKGSIEDIFYVQEGLLPNARGGFSDKSPLGDENVFGNSREIRFPWEKPELEEERASLGRKNRSTIAELTLPESELSRLRNMALRIKNKMKIGGAGVNQEVVEKIHEKWKTSEVVRLKVEGAPALNMRRMHEILERKTGGMVIWRSGTSVCLYRGTSYEAPSGRLSKSTFNKTKIPRGPTTMYYNKDSLDPPRDSPGEDAHPSLAETDNNSELIKKTSTSLEVKYEDEVEKLLEGLGPRYTDWPGDAPLPVDADLLPGVVTDYEPPFRILPYGVRSTLGGKEATALRRLARVVPPHFALGRSRQHQGLAVAMVKLWERSSIAKVALKRGVQLTTSERMAEDIKKLTGGVLLSRNKDFLVFYRGKDFLSRDVAEALLEKERLAKTLQDKEEQARLTASTLVTPSVEPMDSSGTAGTLGETLDADARWGKRLDDAHKEKVLREAEISRHTNLVRKLEKKLAFAERKLMKAEMALSKVEESLYPADQTAEPESLTDEERFMFRKLGLRMKAFLLLGRRGVFDGTVENMHLHWKYRELIKIIVKAKNFEQVKGIALSLEAESGGVLVSVDKVSKGYAIVVFRGKDYQRPSVLRPKNLLTKRKALARSIELQRREALLNHISTVQARADKIRTEIDQMASVKDNGDDELYDKLDSAYPTEDDDTGDEEDEGDEGYPEVYNSDINAVDESENPVDGPFTATNFPYALQSDSETELVES